MDSYTKNFFKKAAIYCAALCCIFWCFGTVQEEHRAAEEDYRTGYEMHDPSVMSDYEFNIRYDVYKYSDKYTVLLCCEKYGLDFDEVYDKFTSSKYDEFQDFFNKVLEPYVKA